MDVNFPDARDRLDQPIFNAIEAKNLKQALKLVDKRLAKKPDEFLQALRCYIQSQHPALSERQAAAVVLQNLVEKQVACADLDVLNLYDEAWTALFPSSSVESTTNLGKLRLFAAKARSKDEKFCKTCLFICLSRDDLANSQQIAVLMEMNFPENRKYPFWSITIMALFAKSTSCPVEQRKLYSRLAYGKIKKLAAATTEITNGTPAPPRSIQEPGELKLLHEIVSKEAGTRECLELLKSPVLGSHSKAAKGEWDFIRAKMLALEELGMWQELFDTCEDLLAKAYTKKDADVAEDTRGGDWAVWTAYIRSTKLLKTPDLHLQVHKMLVTHISPEAKLDKTYRRNAHLAMLYFSFHSLQSNEKFTISDGGNFKIENVPATVSALFTYLNEYSENPSAYDDVGAHVESLAVSEGGILFDILKEMCTPKSFVLYPSTESAESSCSTFYPKREYSAINRITARLNISKIMYLIKICIPESARVSSMQKQSSSQWTCTWCNKNCEIACKTCLTDTLNELMPLYKDAIEDKTLVGLLPTDKHPADDFYILAATCLLKLAGFRPPLESDIVNMDQEIDMACVMQATALLEYASLQSKVNPEIMLFLVRLYSFVGSANLAMRVYKRLRIKQVQFDTLGYTIFDRISSLHPYPFSQLKDELAELHDPEFLLEHHAFYKSMHGHVTKNSWRSLDNGNYNTIFGLVEVSDHLHNSVASVMSVLELRRMNRISRKEAALKQSSYGYDVLPRHPELLTEWHDNSDYLSFPNFEAPSAPRFEQYIRLGPAPSSLRTRAFLMIEKLLILTNTASQALTTRAEVQEEVGVCILAIHQLETELLGQKVLTSSEKVMVDISFDLFKLLHTATEKTKSESADSLKLQLTTHILSSLSQQIKVINSIPTSQPPLFTTCLHPLYISHELASNILTISSFPIEFLASPKTKSPFNTELVEAAKELKKAVVARVTALKKKTLEGGLLDDLIEKVVRLEGLAFDESCLEQWIAEMVGSFEEAVEGLVNCVKE